MSDIFLHRSIHTPREGFSSGHDTQQHLSEEHSDASQTRAHVTQQEQGLEPVHAAAGEGTTAAEESRRGATDDVQKDDVSLPDTAMPGGAAVPNKGFTDEVVAAGEQEAYEQGMQVRLFDAALQHAAQDCHA